MSLTLSAQSQTQTLRYFDTTFYLNSNPDVLAAVAAGRTTPFQHFVTFGHRENRTPTSLFDANAYLANNPDIAVAVGSGRIASGWDHFVNVGIVEGRSNGDFTGTFDSAAYLAANPDVAAAVSGTNPSFRSAYEHFLLFGQAEGRAATNTAGQPINTNPGQTFTLTSGVDNLTGTKGDDVFSGVLSNTAGSTTFTAADNINGNAGIDALKLTIEGALGGLSLPAATVTSVENFFIRDVATGPFADTFNFALIAGEQQVWNDRSTRAVNFTGVDKAATIGLNGDGSQVESDTTVTFATNPTSLSVAIAGGIVKNAADVAVTDLTITNNTIESVSVSSSGAANFLNKADFSGGTTVTSLTIDASSNLSMTLDAPDYVATGAALVVKGAATSVNVGANGTFKTIDASGMTAGGITVTTDAGVTSSVIGGAGKDVLTFAGSTAAATINLGAGDDRLLGTVVPANGVTVDGGAGVDSVAAGLITAGNAAKFANFERIDLAGYNDTLDVSLLTGSTITGLALTGATGTVAAVTNVAKGVGLEVSSTAPLSESHIGVTGAAAATDDTFTITFAGAAQTAVPAAANIFAGGVKLAAIETINIVSEGGANTWNSLTLLNAPVSFDRTTTVNISGSKNLDLVIPTQALAAGTATKDALALVDGSSATGKLSITLNLDGTGADNINTSLAVKGGSAADTFIVVATAPEAGNNLTITGGAGNDKFNVEGLTATTPATSSFLTIADFTKGDQIDGVNTAAAFVSTKFDVGAATTVDEAIGLALAGAANDVRWFQFGGNTFVVYDTAGGGAAASDLVVRATGLLDLSNSTLGAGNGVLTFG